MALQKPTQLTVIQNKCWCCGNPANHKGGFSDQVKFYCDDCWNYIKQPTEQEGQSVVYDKDFKYYVS